MPTRFLTSLKLRFQVARKEKGLPEKPFPTFQAACTYALQLNPFELRHGIDVFIAAP